MFVSLKCSVKDWEVEETCTEDDCPWRLTKAVARQNGKVDRQKLQELQDAIFRTSHLRPGMQEDSAEALDAILNSTCPQCKVGCHPSQPASAVPHGLTFWLTYGLVSLHDCSFFRRRRGPGSALSLPTRPEQPIHPSA